jgi:hypothetical protein
MEACKFASILCSQPYAVSLTSFFLLLNTRKALSADE